MKTLRELQALPDDQIYLCHCEQTAAEYMLACPFRCQNVHWLGGGVVSVQFMPGSAYSQQFLMPGIAYPVSAPVLLKHLIPIDKEN